MVSRQDWQLPVVLQWNLVRSAAPVVRGFHVHLRHVDGLFVAAGTLHVGLRDLRIASTTYRQAEVITLEPFSSGLVIPPGVGHGFLSADPAVHLYGTDEYWDPADELGCRWDDPALALHWPAIAPPKLSERDSAAGTLAQLEATLRDLGL